MKWWYAAQFLLIWKLPLKPDTAVGAPSATARAPAMLLPAAPTLAGVSATSRGAQPVLPAATLAGRT
eukprot:365871-Chlamydomonas_euryale.AAC.1